MNKMIRSNSLSLAALVAALAGCGGGPGNLGETPTINGQVSGWNKGAGTVTASVAFVTASASKQPVATGAIDAAGRFSIVLPGKAQLEPYLKPIGEGSGGGPACDSFLKDVDKSIRLVSLDNVSAEPDRGFLLANIIVPSKHIVYGGYVYVDKPWSIQGDAGQVKCNIQFSPGWNSYTFEVDNDGPVVYNSNSAAIPADMKWLSF